MIVMKFGGTSVQDAAAITRAVEIVRGRLKRKPVVVVSAMARVTDALLAIANLARERRFDEATELIHQLRDRHLSAARELLCEQASNAEGLLTATGQNIEALLHELQGLVRSVATLGELTPRTQ